MLSEIWYRIFYSGSCKRLHPSDFLKFNQSIYSILLINFSQVVSNNLWEKYKYLIDVDYNQAYSYIPDVPNPPGRPMVTGFTSRSITLSWSKPRRSDGAPILGYVITTG